MNYLKDRCAPLHQVLHNKPPYRAIVVIPSFNEKQILRTLRSLSNCQIQKPSKILILVVINHSENASTEIKRQNIQTLSEVQRFESSNPYLEILPLYYPDLPHKKAGVGLARKLGMDQACQLFHLHSIQDGVIITTDADCTFDSNFFQAIFQFYESNPSVWCAHAHFEHLANCEDDPIIAYELHLRIYIHFLKKIGFPFACQTIGSCISVRPDGYAKVGGMPTKKAGEDFYFVHKFTEIDRFGLIPGAMVYPSSRASTRVPFGTGKAISNILDGHDQLTYAPNCYFDLAKLISVVPSLYDHNIDLYNVCNEPTILFLEQQNFAAKLAEIRNHSTTRDRFRKRFFRWMNAFRVMKYLNYCSEHHYEKVELVKAFDCLHPSNSMTFQTDLQRLKFLRAIDRSEQSGS